MENKKKSQSSEHLHRYRPETQQFFQVDLDERIPVPSL
mgnify:CR=1 FL=1